MEQNEQNKTKYYDTFYGHKVSSYALEHGRLDYGTLAKCFDAILCNNIPQVDGDIWCNIESGSLTRFYYDGEEISEEKYEEERERIENEIEEEKLYDNRERVDQLENELDKYEREDVDVFQFYLVSDSALHLLRECNELVLYSDLLDCYVWCVCHWGTSWDYVLTSIKLEERED